MIFFFKTTVAAYPAELQQKLEFLGKIWTTFRRECWRWARSQSTAEVFLRCLVARNLSPQPQMKMEIQVQGQIRRDIDRFKFNWKEGQSVFSSIVAQSICLQKLQKRKLKLFRHQLSEYSSPWKRLDQKQLGWPEMDSKIYLGYFG